MLSAGAFHQCLPVPASRLKDDAAQTLIQGLTPQRSSLNSLSHPGRSSHRPFGTYWGFSPLPVRGSHLPPRKTIKLYALPTASQRLGSQRLRQLGGFLRTMTAVHHSRATRYNTRTDADGACQDRTENQGSDHHGFLLCLCPLPLSSALRAFNITERPCAQAVYAEASCCVNREEKPSALKEKPESE